MNYVFYLYDHRVCIRTLFTSNGKQLHLLTAPGEFAKFNLPARSKHVYNIKAGLPGDHWIEIETER